MPAVEAGPGHRVLPADAGVGNNARLMRQVDALHLAYPFAGARMLRDLLRRAGHTIDRRHVATLMRRMGIEALYRKPHTSHHPHSLSLSPAPSGGHAPESCVGTLPTFRCRAALAMCVPCWTRRVVGCWRGGGPTR